MVKTVRILMLALCMVLLLGTAHAQYEIVPCEGTDMYPDAENVTYIYHYRLPLLDTENNDVVAMVINDTLLTALEEMRGLVLPMLSHEPAMTADGLREITQDYIVTCNNDDLFSFLLTKREQCGDDVYYTIESDVFDVGGRYRGETLTLRGLVMVGDSSDLIAETVLPVLFEEYQSLVQSGICREGIDFEEFGILCSPAMDFYADKEGNAVFFFQPDLMINPSFDVPSFTFTIDRLVSLGLLPQEE